MTEFTKPNNFAYNADLATLANAIVELQEAVNKLEENMPKKRGPKPSK